MAKQRFWMWTLMPSEGCQNETPTRKMIWAESLEAARQMAETHEHEVGAEFVWVSVWEDPKKRAARHCGDDFKNE